jgi:Domain of unknown function (DUF4476)
MCNKKFSKILFPKLFVLGFWLFFIFTVKAQRFAYIQSQNNKPFYVLVNGKNFSSTINGYCTISPLEAKLYKVQIGFPRSVEKEIEFEVDVTEYDQGFLFAENPKPQLLNLQSATNQQSITLNQISKLNLPVLIENNVAASGSINQVYLHQDSQSNIFDTVTLIIPINEKPILVSQNSQKCEVASEQNFFDARLLLAAASNSSDLIQVSQKLVNKYCFSVEQCKNLSYLFVKEVDKFSFFQMAYKNIFDKQNCKNLLILFTNQLYPQSLKQQWNLQ